MKLKYAYKGISKNFIFTVLIIMQLVFAFICIYQNLDFTNKVSKDYDQFKKIFGEYKVYKLELVSSPNKFLDKPTENLEKCFSYLQCSPEYSFCGISKWGLYIEKFKGDLEPFRETNYDMNENQKELFCAKNYILDKISVEKFPIKLYEGRGFQQEEFQVSYGNDKAIPILVGYNYKKYFNIGDEITYHRDQNVLARAKIVGIIKENQVIPGNLMSAESKYLNLNNYIITTDSVNKSEKSMYFQKFVGNYMLFNKEATKQQIEESTENIKNVFEKNADIKVGLRNLNDDVSAEKEIFKEQNKIALGTSIIVIIFVSITIVISLLNSIINRKQEFMIHILNGATLKDISIIIYLEIFIMLIVSYIISIPFIFKFQHSQSKFLLIISFFIMIILSFLIAFIPVLKISNLKISELIKGE